MDLSGIGGAAGTVVSGGNLAVGNFVANAIKWISGLVKGKTAHPTYEEVHPKANDFAGAVYALYKTAYTTGELATIGDKARSLMLGYMSQYWGLQAGFNYAIAQDLQDPSRQNISGEMVLWLTLLHFFDWIGTNIDKAVPESFKQYFDALYGPIFLTAITQAGLDPLKVQNAQAPASTVGGNPAGSTTQAKTVAKTAGLGGDTNMLYLAAAGIALFFLLKKK